ncbi:MAG: hypothetical protein KTR18_12180 [Acidiferrobacterales bacterium]|nr:hypothetical protein [Acidiferrobacterales bacterium]
MNKPDLDFEAMIAQAESTVEEVTVDQAEARKDNDKTLLVDIRDIRELDRDGRIPGAKHIPQGMLEFWMHPGSPYYKDYFDDVDEVILFCNKGWRSARASKGLNDLGFGVKHMAGGFGGWKDAGKEVS